MSFVEHFRYLAKSSPIFSSFGGFYVAKKSRFLISRRFFSLTSLILDSFNSKFTYDLLQNPYLFLKLLFLLNVWGRIWCRDLTNLVVDNSWSHMKLFFLLEIYLFLNLFGFLTFIFFWCFFDNNLFFVFWIFLLEFFWGNFDIGRRFTFFFMQILLLDDTDWFIRLAIEVSCLEVLI